MPLQGFTSPVTLAASVLNAQPNFPIFKTGLGISTPLQMQGKGRTNMHYKNHDPSSKLSPQSFHTLGYMQRTCT